MKRWVITLKENNEGKLLTFAVSGENETNAKDRLRYLIDSGRYFFVRIREI